MKVSDIAAGARIIASGSYNINPLVSIITPTYCRNAEGLLTRCLDSALAQSFKRYEHIVIDDGSSDGSEDTIRRYAARDERIVYIRHDRNSALPAVRANEGILRARGDAIAFLFDDNTFAADFLERTWNALESSQADVVFCNVEMLVPEGKSFLLGGWPLAIELLKNLNTIPNGGVLVRRSFFEKYGLYDPHVFMRRICDWDLWLRALQLGARFHHIDFVGSIEHGQISPNSIGNTVPIDLKCVLGYTLDAAHLRERTESLLPDRIGEFDVLDTSKVMQYVRDEREWNQVIKVIYRPFLTRSKMVGKEPLPLGNRVASHDPSVGWNPSWSPFRERRRVLLVSNVMEARAEAWSTSLANVPGSIVLNCPEWALSSFSPDEVDVLILVDVTALFLAPLLQKFRAMGTPILYVLGTGASIDCEAKGLSNSIDYRNNEHIHAILGSELYFPQTGVSFSRVQESRAEQLIALADVVVADIEDNRMGSVAKLRTPEAPEKSAWIANLLRAVRLTRHLTTSRDIPFRSIRIGVFLYSEMISGAEVYGIRLAKSLAIIGFNVQTFVPDHTPYGSDLSMLNGWLNRLDLPNARRAPYAPGAGYHDLSCLARNEECRNLSKFLIDEAPDIIICSGYMPIFADLDPAHGWSIFMALFQPSAYDGGQLTCLRGRVSGIMTDSEWALGFLTRVFGGPAVLVRTALPTHKLASTSPRDPITDSAATVRIAIAGTLQPRKRQLEAIDVVQILLNNGFDVKLNIYGLQLDMLNDYIAAIEERIAEYGLGESVYLHGLVDPDVISTSNDIIFTASIDESLPQSLIIQMQAGLIAVAGLSGGIDEIVIDNVTGYLTHDLTANGLAEALQRAIDDRPRWHELANAAVARIERHFSVGATTANLLDLMIEGSILDWEREGRLRHTTFRACRYADQDPQQSLSRTPQMYLADTPNAESVQDDNGPQFQSQIDELLGGRI